MGTHSIQQESRREPPDVAQELTDGRKPSSEGDHRATDGNEETPDGDLEPTARVQEPTGGIIVWGLLQTSSFPERYFKILDRSKNEIRC